MPFSLFMDFFRNLCFSNFLKIICRKEVKSMYVSYNANPDGNRVGDCTIRAISKALNQKCFSGCYNLRYI